MISQMEISKKIIKQIFGWKLTNLEDDAKDLQFGMFIFN